MPERHLWQCDSGKGGKRDNRLMARLNRIVFAGDGNLVLRQSLACHESVRSFSKFLKNPIKGWCICMTRLELFFNSKARLESVFYLSPHLSPQWG